MTCRSSTFFFVVLSLAFWLFCMGCTKKVSTTECAPGVFCPEGYKCVPDGQGGFSCALASCGNQIVEPAEECDDGEGNAFTPNTCRPDCTLPACGDGVVDDEYGESCDDGNQSLNDSCPDGLGGTCQPARCGDGHVWDTDGGEELCDDGNETLSDDCPDGPDGSCRPARCGDGYRFLGHEVCDCGEDPLDLPSDAICQYGPNSDTVENACRTDCTTGSCGDGILDVSLGEECDNGTANADLPDACRLNCLAPRCNDGIQDSDEECDQGSDNAYLPDTCRPTCDLPACGDNITDPGNNEECDEGTENAYLPDRCRPNCRAPTCGDSITDPAYGEECDDGNLLDGDGCSADCHNEACGNGLPNPGEGCDDGNNQLDDRCPDGPGGSCQPAFCGDGYVWNTDGGNEGCDDGANVAGDGCSVLCQIEPGWDCTGQPSICDGICGDGLIRGQEECHDDDLESGDGCDGACRIENGWVCGGEPSVCNTVCGDGFIRGDEECDDDNGVGGDGCSDQCEVEDGFYCVGEPSVCYTECGDGLIRGAEGCDDDNTTPGDGCSASCQVEPGFYCWGEPSTCVRIGEFCEADPPVISGSTTLNHTLIGYNQDYNGNGCGEISVDTNGPDRVYAIDMNADDWLVAWIAPSAAWDAVLYLSTVCPFSLPSNCPEGWQRAAENGARERLDYVATGAGTVYLVVDSRSAAAGTYQLQVTMGSSAVLAGTEGQVIFSEIMPYPDGIQDRCQWFEVANTQGFALNLQGLRFEQDASSFIVDHPLILRPTEHMVFGTRGEPSENCRLTRVSWLYSGVDLPTTGSSLGIFSISAGIYLDSLTYTGTWPYSEGHSMYLCTNHTSSTDNDDPANWQEDLFNIYDTVVPQNYGTPASANPGTCN